MPGSFSGSSGYTSASRIRAVIEHFLTLDIASQTSVRFANMWSSRAVEYLDPPDLSYIIPDEGNTAAGWSSYVYRLYGSTRNTSSGGVFSIRGLPDAPYREFLADRSTLMALATAISGTTDADHGRRVFPFLVSTVIDTTRYRNGGPHREILIAWAAAGSSEAPTS